MENFKEIKKERSNIMAKEYEKLTKKVKQILLQENEGGYEFKIVES